GLAVAALADAGAAFDRPEWVEAARTTARLLLDVHDLGASGGRRGRLLRASRDGRAGTHLGVLEDQGDVAEGLLALYAATGEASWLHAATPVVDVVIDLFSDSDGDW